jgi:hypothetical protein
MLGIHIGGALGTLTRDHAQDTLGAILDRGEDGRQGGALVLGTRKRWKGPGRMSRPPATI